MGHWILSMFSVLAAWASTYDNGAAASLVAGYAAPAGLVISFGWAIYLCKENDCPFWRSLGIAVLSALGGFVLAAVVSAILAAIFPYLVYCAIGTAIVTMIFAPIYYGPHLGGWAMSLIGWIYGLGRKMFHRLKPKDHLDRLDKSAQEVERRRQELFAQQARVAKQAKEHFANAQEAQESRKNFPAGSAGAQIADGLLVQFQKNFQIAQTQASKLDAILGEMVLGQQEMSKLISLARLCRKAGEKITENTAVIAAAYKALHALRAAWEEADAVLSAEVLELPEMDANLAWRQLDEGCKRSTRLADSAERINQSAPSRTRV